MEIVKEELKTVTAIRGKQSLKPCTCADHTHNVARINGSFCSAFGEMDQWRVDFVLANLGKAVCYDCGGEVIPTPKNADHVTANTITSRLQELGLIGPHQEKASHV